MSNIAKEFKGLPAFVQWVVGLAVLAAAWRWLVPFVFKASGVADLEARRKAAQNKSVVEEMIKQAPDVAFKTNGSPMTVDSIDMDVSNLWVNGFRHDRGFNGLWEDEELIISICNLYTRASFHLLVERYNIKGRDLIVDLKRYLSESELQRVNHLFL